jgi:hypothetical protein
MIAWCLVDSRALCIRSQLAPKKVFAVSDPNNSYALVLHCNIALAHSFLLVIGFQDQSGVFWSRFGNKRIVLVERLQWSRCVHAPSSAICSNDMVILGVVQNICVSCFFYSG